MHDVPAHSRVRLDAQHVDSAEVRQVVVADVVHVVELDAVIPTSLGREAPDPPERDGDMVKVADFASQQGDCVRVLHQDPSSFSVDQRPAGHLAVVDGHSACP